MTARQPNSARRAPRSLDGTARNLTEELRLMTIERDRYRNLATTLGDKVARLEERIERMMGGNND